MFCPGCHAEYRPGFLRCNECDLDLVEVLPTHVASNRSAQEHSANFRQLLWRGLEGSISNGIAQALDQAGIPYERKIFDVKVSLSSTDLQVEIYVPTEALESARQALTETANPLSGSDAVDLSQDDQDDANDELGPLCNDDSTTTIDVWRGSDEVIARFLESCLTENGIDCQVGCVQGVFCVQALLESKSRAQHIIREVLGPLSE